MKLLSSKKCTSLARLDGKTAIITGANTGIGKETAKDFFKRGARVILACRDLSKANLAIEDIRSETSDCENLGEMVATKLDLSSLSSVKSCSESLLRDEPRIDLLINNAGLMVCPQGKTEDGFELQIGTNHFGHFLLTILLLPRIRQSTPARIVNVSSNAHSKGVMHFEDLNWEKRSYSPLRAYGQSKLANILFTKELARRIQEANIPQLTAYSLHPGVVKTELGRHMDDTYFRGLRWLFGTLGSWFLKTPLEGAQTTIHCAVSEECAEENGLYYAECEAATPSPRALIVEDAKRLWKESLKMVGLPEDTDPFC